MKRTTAAVALVAAFLAGNVTGPILAASTTVHLRPGDQITVIADPAPTPALTPIPQPTPTLPSPTPVVTPAPTASVRRVDSTISPSAFSSLASDMSIDVIEMAAGSYHRWRDAYLNVDRTSRPLTIRPAPGATVTFDAASDGSYGDAAFPIGGAHITIDGSGGRFVFAHYLLAQDGLFRFVGGRFITVRGVTAHNIAGNTTSATEQAAHFAYVSRGSHDITFDDIALSALQASDEPGGVHGLNGLHVYTGGTGAAVYNVTATRWTVDRANWAAVIRNGTTGVKLDGWTVTNSGHGVPAVMDFGSDNTGSAANIHTSGSLTTPVTWGRIVNAGGCSFA
jgi:hypothetical protein